jgi:hypothetical protein
MRRVERLPSGLFSVLLDVLAEQRGDFLAKVSDSISQHIREILHGKDLRLRYTFESIDKQSLKQQPMDSPELIRFCELE